MVVANDNARITEDERLRGEMMDEATSLLADTEGDLTFEEAAENAALSKPAEGDVVAPISFAMVDITERDMDFLFAEEFRVRRGLSHVVPESHREFGGVEGLVSLGRSVNTRHGESDLLLVHWTLEGQRRAIMVENKVSAPFMPLQAQRYRIRGAEGVKLHQWDAFTTVLLAPVERLAEVADDAFDCRVSYEEAASRVGGAGTRAEFKRRMLKAACEKTKTPWVASVDEAVTDWFVHARRFGISAYPDLPLPAEGAGRPPGNTWMTFNLREFPQSRVGIEIKPVNGVVDLRVKGASIGDLRRMLGDYLPAGADTVEAVSGRSVSIRCTHQPADVSSPFGGQEALLWPMFGSADWLLRFAREHQTAIMRLIGYAQ